MGSFNPSGPGAGAPALPTPSVLNLRPANQIRFAVEDVPPPSQTYVGINDRLQLQFAANGNIANACFLEVRVLKADGGIAVQEETITVQAGTFPAALSFPLPEGFLLSVAVTPKSGVFVRGNVFVMISLVRGSGSSQQYSFMLAHGYVGRIAPVCWPYPRVDSPTAFGGLLNLETVSNPAAGVDWAQQLDPSSRQRIMAVTATLLTSAAVANRAPILQVRFAAITVGLFPAGVVQAASLSVQYTWFPGAVLMAAAFSGVVNAPFPHNLILNSGFFINTATPNIQAADQWSAIAITSEEWLDE
jgi:hypothetical protein